MSLFDYLLSKIILSPSHDCFQAGYFLELACLFFLFLTTTRLAMSVSFNFSDRLLISITFHLLTKLALLESTANLWSKIARHRVVSFLYIVLLAISQSELVSRDEVISLSHIPAFSTYFIYLFLFYWFNFYSLPISTKWLSAAYSSNNIYRFIIVFLFKVYNFMPNAKMSKE